jgi:hypothetical protein
MAKAFSPFVGKLTVAPNATIEVQDGILNLFGGAVAVFGNPESDMPIDYDDGQVAVGIIMFVELLLEVLAQAKQKP